MAKIVKYNGVVYNNFPDTLTGAQALAALKIMYSELETGSFRENADGSIDVFVVAQNKSAKIVKYNGVVYNNFPDTLTGAQALAALKIMYSELETGSFRENADGSIDVFVVAQNKSAKIVKYNGVVYNNFPDTLTGAQALAALKIMYSELETGSFRENADGSIDVFVVAQNKSKPE